MRETGFKLYLLFVISWFTHLTARISPLGLVRFDLCLILLLTIILILTKDEGKQEPSETETILKVLIIYILITIPFVEWPGSVIKRGIPNFIKVIIFYYFTVHYVNTEKKFMVFIGVFLACQSFRIAEPLYLHITTGYWGGMTYVQGGFVYRLAGSPYDIVNANGLAYIIASVIPFYYFLVPLSWKHKVIFIGCVPVFVYALILTGSRSGLLAFLVTAMGFIYKSKRKVLFTIIAVVAAGAVFINLSPDHQARYLSIVDPNTKHSLTAQARMNKVTDHFKVALHKPLFGHGLSTSIEANYEYTGEAILAHDLYVEVAQELGFVGLIIFVWFMKSIIMNFSYSYKKLKSGLQSNPFLSKITDAMQVWLLMNIVFSFASFGLSSYTWYLFAGLSVVLVRLSTQINPKDEEEEVWIKA